MRLIDADALKEKIDSMWNGRPLSSLGARILVTIDEAPTIDADRPQGENLLEKYPSLFECSVCGASCFDTIPWDCNINYCPNCGAKMSNASNASNTLETLATLERGETE